ncbi:hypothetical protein HKCCSP123_00845 [Rhodobacterales bacterium HKCCSP123]|nr:hypothetical protein [Rhodobacterales bacterium HKCCSP123]
MASSEITDHRQIANGLAIDTGDGEVRRLCGSPAKLVRRLALAGTDRLRLVESDLKLAEELAANGIPLRVGRRDAKGRARVALAQGVVVCHADAR